MFQALRELLFIDPSRHRKPNDRPHRYLQQQAPHETLKRIGDLEQNGLHDGILHLSEARGAHQPYPTAFDLAASLGVRYIQIREATHKRRRRKPAILSPKVTLRAFCE